MEATGNFGILCGFDGSDGSVGGGGSVGWLGLSSVSGVWCIAGKGLPGVSFVCAGA